jgi:endonuclease/exonuclease/phosphatase family metal-dependent hydrolase
MWKQTPALVLLALSCSITRPDDAPSRPAEELRIAAWNVENLFDTIRSPEQENPSVYNEDQLKEKLTKDAQVIKDLNADIVGLIEVENRGLLRTLCTEYLKGSGYDYFELIEDIDPRGIDVGLISRRPFLAHSFELPGHTRGVLACRFMVAAEPLYVLVNHWKSRIGGGEAKRMASAREIVRLCNTVLPQYEGKSVATVILGDFNDEDTDDSVKALEAGGLFNTLKGQPAAERWTLAYDDRSKGRVLHQGFDHVFVNAALKDGRGLEWQTGSSSVVRLPYLINKRTVRGVPYDWPVEDYGKQIGYSDHLPVVTRVASPARNGAPRTAPGS